MIQQVNRDDYDIRDKPGGVMLYQELAWYATDDHRAIGVVLLDRIDKDYSWVVLTENDQGPGYTAVDLMTSLDSEEAATIELHAALVAESNR